jgi:hypothetical protein
MLRNLSFIRRASLDCSLSAVRTTVSPLPQAVPRLPNSLWSRTYASTLVLDLVQPRLGGRRRHDASV